MSFLNLPLVESKRKFSNIPHVLISARQNAYSVYKSLVDVVTKTFFSLTCFGIFI